MVMITVMVTATSTVVVAHDAAADVRQVDAEFFALIYSDPELLRDEFEELVAAAWSGRPPPTAEPGRGSGHPPDRPTVDRPFAGGGRPARPVAGARECGARTRSPPASLPHDERRPPTTTTTLGTRSARSEQQ